jgi:thiol:disulfide interchange protein DsbD
MGNLAETLSGLLGSGEGMVFLAYPIAFLAGFITSLTPCVYPVIPIIAGYIGGQAQKSRRKSFVLSVFYVIGMALTYSALGAFAALSGRMFGQIQSSPAAHIIVANIIIFFGLSMLGVFTMPMLPVASSADSKERKRDGVFGALGMGLISGLVTSPCTVAVVGVMLTYVAARQNVFLGITLLFTFALGMGVLLVLVGTFVGALSSLPKSGMWLQRIQKGFAFLMILLGEYFLIRAGRLLF